MLHQTREQLRAIDAGAVGTAGASTSMNKIRLIRIGLAVGIPLATLFLFKDSVLATFTSWRSQHAEGTVPVLMADRYLMPFQIVKNDAVTIKRFPAAFVPVGALQAVSDLVREDGQPLYTTVVGIPEGQPLTRMVLSEAGRERGMSSLLRPGKVAVAFSTERSRAAGGWIRPGDTIAIFETRPISAVGRENGALTRILLEAVPVLAVDQEHMGQKPKKPSSDESDIKQFLQLENGAQTLTVLVGTRDASALVEARERGPLSVVLRPLGDDLPWVAP